MDEIEKINRQIKGIKCFPFGEENGIKCLLCKNDYDNCLCNYTEDIKKSWELFEEMAMDCKAHISYYNEESGVEKWHCTTLDQFTRDVITVKAISAPLAICKAYLEWF
jgi:hypothetical protein